MDRFYIRYENKFINIRIIIYKICKVAIAAKFAMLHHEFHVY